MELFLNPCGEVDDIGRSIILQIYVCCLKNSRHECCGIPHSTETGLADCQRATPGCLGDRQLKMHTQEANGK